MRKILLLMICIAMLSCQGLFAQKKEISGRIADVAGTPIPGATIKIKGTKIGTSAGFDGTFRIIAAAKSVLVISGVGYESKEVIVPEEVSELTISLNQDVRALSEVVVTGSGIATSKRKLAFAVESVTSEHLPPGNTASIDQALVGKVAGAQISSISGVPGSSVNILLRGINSISAGTTPMILVDGVQMGASGLNTLDLSSIDRVEIVQGAASSTIYGAQGANGVIQIFTKRGKPGAPQINFSSSVASNTYLNIGDVRKAKLHGFAVDANNVVLDASNLPVQFDTATGQFTNSPFFDVLNPANTMSHAYDKNLKYFDHLGEFMVTAPLYNVALSVSGAKDKTDYFISVSNNHQQSNFKSMGYNDRSNFTSNLGFELFKGFKLRSTTQLVYTRNTINGNQSLVYALMNSKPFVNYDQKMTDGNFINYYGNAVGVNGRNPNYQNQYTHSLNNYVDVIQTFNASYRVNRFVDLDAKYGINYEQGDQRYRTDNQSQNANAVATNHFFGNFSSNNQGEIDRTNFSTIFQNFLGTATIHFDFANDFHLKIPLQSQTLVGFDYRNSKYTAYSAASANLPLYTPINGTEGTAFKVYQDYVQPFITYGFLVSQKFDWGNLFGITGGFRTDYSSAFGAGSKPFTFPNGSAYLRLSSFDFWKNAGLEETFSEVKLRASYGEAGIQPGPFQRYNTLGTQLLGSSSSFFFNANQPNPNLGVEVSKEFEAGIDVNFRIAKNGDWFKQGYFSPTYWDRRTDNAIIPVDAAPSTGVGTIVNNAFGLKSHGFQFKVGVDVVATKSINWNLSALYGHQTSEISFVQGQPIVEISSAGSTNYILKQGLKIGQLFGYLGLHSVDQVDPTTGTPYIDKADQGNYTLASNGWVVDKATKQPYFTPNQYSFGDPNPKFNLSFINEISFKSWLSVNFQIDWLEGQHLYNQTKEWMYRDAIHADYEQPITIDGQTGAWTAFYRGVYAQRQRNGTKNYFYEDASFVRLRNVSVAIDVAPLLRINKVVKKLQFVFSGRNLITITKYTGFDPEISSGSGNSAWDRGTDHSTLPNFKTYQAGINVGF